MNNKQLTLSCAVLAFSAGLAGQVYAQDVVPSKATKTTTKAATKAPAKTQNTKSTNVEAAAKAVEAAPVVVKDAIAAAPVKDAAAAASVQQPVAEKSTNPFLAAQSANPYLTGQQKPNPYLTGQHTPNPYLVNRPINPWLAPQSAKPAVEAAVMPATVLFPVVPKVAANAAAPQTSANPSGRKHISLSPLPVDIYMNPGIRPAVAFSTPCVTIAKMTNNFPPILAFENFMFGMIGKVNESEMLPFSVEPVCV